MAEIPGARHIHSSNRGQKLFEEDVILIVLQYTRLDSMSSAIQHYCGKYSKASTHGLIGRDGRTVQLVKPDWIAWHCPRGANWNGYTNLNQRSVGIALDNVGPLLRNADGVAKPIGSGMKIPEPEVFRGEHRYGRASFRDWHAYPQEQLEALDRVLTGLVPQFPKLQAIVGADELCPLSQLAPGPALPARFLEIGNYR